MNGHDTLHVVARPGDQAIMGGAAYEHFGPKGYVDALLAFQDAMIGNTLTFSGGAAHSAITLTYQGATILAHDNGKCGSQRVSFDGTYQRQ